MTNQANDDGSVQSPPSEPATYRTQAQTPTSKSIDEQWKTYGDFWRIVGRHSTLWNYPKTETILKLQAYIDSLVTLQCLEALQAIVDNAPENPEEVNDKYYFDIG